MSISRVVMFSLACFTGSAHHAMMVLLARKSEALFLRQIQYPQLDTKYEGSNLKMGKGLDDQQFW